MALDKGLLIADVAHARLLPKRHAFAYKVYYLCFSIRKLSALKNQLLSLTGFNLFAFHSRNYGFGGESLEHWSVSVLKQYNITQADGDTVLLTMPKVLGYGFNPVSFWFCLDAQGALRAVLSEVNNTFGEKHVYISFHDDKRIISAQDWLEGNKIFHVSPFMPVRGTYRFRFAYSEDKIGAWIDYYDGEEKYLTTSLIGKRSMLNATSLLRCFFVYPLVTLKVIGLIHYHALRLVLKGIKYNNKPTPPSEEISR